MFTKSGFIAKQSTDLSKQRGLYRGFLLRAFADEGDNGAGDNGGNGDNSPQINFETLIANARKEEKEKLYPRIKKLEDENKALVQTNNDNLMKLAAAQKELDEMKANNGESQVIKDLKAQLETAQAEIKTLKETTPNEEELRAKIEAEYKVKLYRQTKLSEGAEQILSVFADEVKGATKEEIDSSFAKAVEKTVATKKQLGLIDEDGNPIETKKTTSKKEDKKDTKKSATPPVANPSTEEDEKFDLDYVQSLDPRSPEYAEFRKKMGLR